jgi:drug/metabolite transporter (DMT)-like permease
LVELDTTEPWSRSVLDYSPPVVAVLVILSALLHALWNAILKKQEDKDVAGALVVTVAALAAIAAALFMWAVRDAAPFPHASGIAWSAGAGLFEAAYFVLLVLALERAPLAVAYTVSRGVAILAVWPISIALLGEGVSALSMGGTALLCLGLACNSLSRGAGPPRGLTLACLCGLAIAGYHLCYKQALAAGGEPAAVFAVSLALACPLNLARLGRAGLGRLGPHLRARPLLVLGMGAITATSFLVFLVALARGGAGFVLTLRNTSIVFAALIGWMLGERPTRPQLIGAALVASGAMLVGVSR